MAYYCNELYLARIYEIYSVITQLKHEFTIHKSSQTFDLRVANAYIVVVMSAIISICRCSRRSDGDGEFAGFFLFCFFF